MADELKGFIGSLKAKPIRGGGYRRPNTLRSYAYCVLRFGAFLAEEPRRYNSYKQAKRPDVEQFLATFRSRKLVWAEGRAWNVIER